MKRRYLSCATSHSSAVPFKYNIMESTFLAGLFGVNKALLRCHVFAVDILQDLEAREVITADVGQVVRGVCDQSPEEGMDILCDAIVSNSADGAIKEDSLYAAFLSILLRSNDGAYKPVVQALHPELTEAQMCNEASLSAFCRSLHEAQDRCRLSQAPVSVTRSVSRITVADSNAVQVSNNVSVRSNMSELSTSISQRSPSSTERSASSLNHSGFANSSRLISTANSLKEVTPSHTINMETNSDGDGLRASLNRLCTTKTKSSSLLDDDPDNGEPKPKHDRSPDSTASSPGVKSVLFLRDYQLELADLALQGRNVLINAPTGSGKTCVAIHIANEHVKRKNAEAGAAQKPKVAFLVTTQNLVEQQKARFEQFSSLRVTGLVGGEQSVKQRVPLKLQLEKYDVFVMTAAILFNSIRAQQQASTPSSSTKGNVFDDIDVDKLESIGAFSLIIFDECHHCDKDHVYNRIMRDHYLPLKLGVTAASAHPIQLPQIIGLTASPGTGQAKNASQALEHLLSLCARLDAERFVKVDNQISRLHEFMQSPSSEVKRCTARSPDKFAQHLLKLMEQISSTVYSLIQQHKDAIISCLYSSEVEFRKLCPPAVSLELVGTAIWSSYTGTAEMLLSQLQSQLGPVRHELKICVQMLKLYNTAMRLNKIARHADALNYLRSVFNQSTSLMAAWNLSDGFEQKLADALAEDTLSNDAEHSCSVSAPSSKKLSIKQTAIHGFHLVEDQLEQLARAEIVGLNDQKSTGVNQKLLALKFEILKQFEKDKNSRVLVFVCERRDGIALYEFCRSDEHLSQLNVGRLAGANAACDDGGLSLRQQDELLRLFSEGHHRVVVSTSVAEEGVDIARCNLVIRYSYVTNEIAMVQSKGRARAKNSRYVLVVDSDELEQREADNNTRDILMNDAIELLCQLEELTFTERVRKLQSAEWDAWQKRQSEEIKQTATTNDTFNILCKVCSSFISTSKYLAKILDSHIVVMDAAVYDHFYVAECVPLEFAQCKFTHKLVCANKDCLQLIGQLCRYRDYDFCVLAIKSIILEDRQTKACKSYKQWKKVPVQIASASSQQICEYCISTAECKFKTLSLFN